MKYLGLLGISSLLTTLVAAAPLEKRVYVYATVTEEVVVTVDVTTTITVTGAAGAQTKPADAVTTTNAGATQWDQKSSDDNPPSYGAPAAPVPPAAVVTAPAPVEQAPAPVETAVANEAPVDPAPQQPAPQQPAAEQVAPAAPPAAASHVEPVPAPSQSVAAQGSTSSAATSGSKRGSCAPESACVGEATVYDAYPDPDHPTACGDIYDGTKDRIAALSVHLMGTASNGKSAAGPGDPSKMNPYCGRSIQVTYQDKTIVVPVQDKCMGCAYENIDLSRAAWAELGIYEDTRIYDVAWKLLPAQG